MKNTGKYLRAPLPPHLHLPQQNCPKGRRLKCHSAGLVSLNHCGVERKTGIETTKTKASCNQFYKMELCGATSTDAAADIDYSHEMGRGKT